MQRVTINISPADLELVREQAAQAQMSVSAYVAAAARRAALADTYAAAAAAEEAPVEAELAADAARIAAKRAFTPAAAVSGAA